MNGVETRTGMAWDLIQLEEGMNRIQIRVTAPTGRMQTYRLTVIRETASTFAQQAYVKASNTDSRDYFGFAVAVSGDTLAVGVPGDDSHSEGINGNEADERTDSWGTMSWLDRVGGASHTHQFYRPGSRGEFGSRAVYVFE